MEDVISVARGAAGHFAITIHESRDDGVGRKEGSGRAFGSALKNRFSEHALRRLRRRWRRNNKLTSRRRERAHLQRGASG